MPNAQTILGMKGTNVAHGLMPARFALGGV